MLLIRLSSASDDLPEAVGCLRAALALRPDQAQVYNVLGRKQEYLDREAEAMSSYERTIELDPAYLLAHYNLAVILQKRGQTDEAIVSLRRVAAIDPGHPGPGAANERWKRTPGYLKWLVTSSQKK